MEFLKDDYQKYFSNLSSLLAKGPTIGKGVFIAKPSAVVGDVVLEDNSSIWYNVTLRADVNRIHVGKDSNIQDNSCVHVNVGIDGANGTYVGDRVTVGHSVTLHACTIGNNSLIGMGATIMDGAEIGENCIIGANALISPGKKIESGSVVVGAPGKVVRSVTKDDQKFIDRHWEFYIGYKDCYLKAISDKLIEG